MTQLQSLVFALSRLCAGAAALIVVGMVLHILLEIVLRALFATSTFALDEMVGYGIASATFLSLGYAFEHGSLIRVGLVIDRLSGRARRALEVLCALATLFAAGLVTWYLAQTAIRSFARGRTSGSVIEVPLWIPEAISCLGLAVFCLQVFAYLCRHLMGTRGPITTAHDLQNDL